MKSFTFPIHYLLYLSLSVLRLKTIGATCGFGRTPQIIRCLSTPFAFYLCLSASSADASPPPGHDTFICQIIDHEDMMARDSLYVATKHALNLNAGEPRTVRMIYFVPNDRPFQQAVMDSMKVTIRQVQTFFADQMEAHGHGRKTFRVETDAQGEPVVHRVVGQHPDSHYLDNTIATVTEEIQQDFDIYENIYFIAVDNSIDGIARGDGRISNGVGGRRGKNGGVALLRSGFIYWEFRFFLSAHELGHTFGLEHDFSDNTYILSYGGLGRYRLSACHAEYLAVHPYFNASVPTETGRTPTIDIISPTSYTASSKSIPVQLAVYDADGLHQVILFVRTREPHGAAGFLEVKACRGLIDETNAVVQFDYDGIIPSDNLSRLWNPHLHPISIQAVDTHGNRKYENFELNCENCPLTLVKNSGDNQQDAPGSILTNPLIVEVQDKNGAEIEGIPVTFTVTAGNGTLGGRFTIENTTTDANGIAQSTLTLGPNVGTNTVEVSVAGLDPVTFTAEGVGTPAVPIAGGDYRTWHLPAGAMARLGKGNIGDSDRRVAFSPDGQYLAVASSIGVWLYEVATSRPLALLPTKLAHSVVFAPDGTMLATGLDNGRVELWELETITKIATLVHGSRRITSVVFSPDGTRLASGSWDQIIKLWDVAERREVGFWEVARTDNSLRAITVAFSPDGATIASGFQDGTVRLWDVGTRTEIATLEGHTSNIRSVAFSLDGTMLASAGNYPDYTLKLWDIATRTEIATLEGRSSSVSFSPDGTMLASAGNYPDYTLKLWDIATRTEIATLEGRSSSVSFSPDGTTLASSTADGTIRLWDIETRNSAIIYGHTRNVFSVSFSPDGTMLATGAYGKIKLWDVATRTEIATLEEHTYRVNSVSFSPDGTMLATGAYGKIKLWDVATRTEIATLEEHTGAVNSVSFSPDGTMLATGAYGKIKLWDVGTRRNIATLEGHTGAVYSVSFSPDGTMLASGSEDRTIKLWDVATRRNIATLEGHTHWVYSVSFSPGGTTLASGSEDRTIKLWDVGTRRNIATLEGHTGAVNSVSFSPDGTMLASGARDLTIKLWDVATRRNIATLEGHTHWVHSVSFSPDGTTLASGSSWDGTILLWDMEKLTSPLVRSDFNGDGMVDVSDFLLFVEQFGFRREDEGYEARFDLDGDGVIGIGDFLIFGNNFGKSGS